MFSMFMQTMVPEVGRSQSLILSCQMPRAHVVRIVAGSCGGFEAAPIRLLAINKKQQQTNKLGAVIIKERGGLKAH